jgi:hypothetical protein
MYLKYFLNSVIIISWLIITLYLVSDDEDTTIKDLKKERKALLTHYSTNAPMPPRQFKHSEHPRPPHPENFIFVFGSASNHPYKDFIAKHYFDENDEFIKGELSPSNEYQTLSDDEIPNGLKQEIINFHERNKKRTIALQKWEQDNATQRIVQWRFHYAEQMTANYLTIIK